MKVVLTEMHSILDAIRTMYMSKRSWTEEKELELKEIIDVCTDRYGRPLTTLDSFDFPEKMKFDEECRKLFKWGAKHITMLRFLDCSVIVEGLHRGGTDDFDAHAKRLENRIIRSSTRLATYETEEISEWYQDKIIPTDIALAYLGISTPDTIEYDGNTYVRTTNGYIIKGMENDKDVKRGLYMLSLPMTFTFKVNITELAHIYKERGSKDGGAHGTAAPELQIMIEILVDQVNEWYPWITRELLLEIIN